MSDVEFERLLFERYIYLHNVVIDNPDALADLYRFISDIHKDYLINNLKKQND